MDLAKLNIPETISLHLEFPTMGKLYADDEKTKPVTISLYSPAADVVVDYKHKIQRKAMAKYSKKGFRNNGILSPEEIDEQDIERMSIFTAGVNNLIYEGKEITTKDISKVYANPKMGWLCDQVREKISGWEDFLEQ